MKARVKLDQAGSKVAVIETDATKGANLGVDIYYNGALLDPRQVLNYYAPRSAGSTFNVSGGGSSAPGGDLTTDDVAEGSRKYFSDERAQDAVGSILSNAGTVNFTYDDGVPSIVASVENSGVAAATYGSSTQVGQFTVLADGRISSAANVAIAFPPLGTTLTALAATSWALNAFPVGTGASTVAMMAFAANQFGARASTGDFEPKPITDFALSLVDDVDAAAMRATLGITAGGAITRFLTADELVVTDTLAVMTSLDLPLDVGQYKLTGVFLMQTSGSDCGIQLGVQPDTLTFGAASWVGMRIESLGAAYSTAGDLLRGVTVSFDGTGIIADTMDRHPYYILRIDGTIDVTLAGDLQLLSAVFTDTSPDGMNFIAGGHWQALLITN